MSHYKLCSFKHFLERRVPLPWVLKLKFDYDHNRDDPIVQDDAQFTLDTYRQVRRELYFCIQTGSYGGQRQAMIFFGPWVYI